MKPMHRLMYKQYTDTILVSNRFLLDADVGKVEIHEDTEDTFIAYIYKGKKCIEVLGDPVLKDLKIRVRKKLKTLGVVMKNEIRQGKILPP